MENRNIKSFVWAWTWTQMRIWEQHRIADLWFNLPSGGILPEIGKRLQLCAFVKPKVQSSKLLLFTTGAGCTSTRSKSEVCGHWTSSLGIGIAETWNETLQKCETRWRWGLYPCGDQVQPLESRFDHEQISRLFYHALCPESCDATQTPLGIRNDLDMTWPDHVWSCFGWKKSRITFFGWLNL